MDYEDKTRDELISEIGNLQARIHELEESQKILTETERNFRVIFDAIPDSIFFMKADGEVLEGNRNFVDRLGVDMSAVIGKNIYEYIPEDVGGSRRIWIDRALMEKRPVDWIDDRNGMLMHHHVVPIFNECGEADRLAIYAGDITHRLAVEENLEKSRRVYDLLFKNMLDGVAHCKMIYENGRPFDFIYLDVNDSFERHSGLKNVIGRKVSELVPKITELDQNLLDIYSEALSTGKPQRFEIYVSSMKEWFDLSVYGLDNETFVSVFNNITSRKFAEKQLQSSEQKFRRFIETANEGVWSMDKDHKTTLVNQKMLDMLGFTSGEMIGFPVTSFMYDEDLTGHRERMESRKHGKDAFYQHRFRHKDGHEVWTLVSATALKSEDGEFAGSFAMFTDITEMKKTLQALSESEQQYKAVENNIEIGITVLNPKMEIVSVNRFFRNYFPDVTPGCSQTCYEQFNSPPRSAPCEYCPCVQTLKDGKVHEAVTSTPKGSETRHFHLVSSPILDDQGSVAYVVELTKDITDTFRESERLRLETSKLKSILDNMNDGVYIVNADHEVNYVNPVLRSNHGDPSGKRCYEYFYNRSTKCPWCKTDEILTGKSVHWERTFSRTGKTFEIFSAPLKNEDGTVYHLEILHDVSHYKQTEEELRHSEERLKLKLDSILDVKSELAQGELINILDLPDIQAIMDDFYSLTGAVFALLDLQGNILCANGWQDICTNFHRKHPETLKNCLESDLEGKEGLKPGDIVSYKCKNNLNDVVSPLFIADKLVGHIYTGQFLYDDQEIDVEKFRLQARRFGFDESEYLNALSLVPRFNRERVATVMSFLVKFTSLISKLGYSNLQLASSILEQKRVETSLRGTQEDLRIIVEQAPIILISSAGTEEKVSYINPKFSELLGYRPDEMKSWDEWWSIAYHDEKYRQQVMTEWTTRVEAAISNKTAIEPLEVKVRCKDGSEKIIEWGFVSTGLKNVVFGVDLTQRKLAEREKESFQEKFLQAQKMEAIGTLAGGIAHDFNNLLQVVIGYAELLNTDDQFPTELKKDLEKIIRAAMDGGDLVKGLLTFGRKTQVKKLSLDLNQHISKIRKLLVRTIPKMIGIELKLQEDLPSINADKTQIEQVLMNLAVNARDAMPNGGTLMIETSTATLSETSLANVLSVRPGSYVRLRVTDTGVGMEKEIQARIFEPFFTTKEPGRGTGLGLAVVYGIVQQHDGYMTCSSETGKGSTFDIFVPAVESTVAAMPEEKRQQVFLHGAGKTILLVDDDEAVRAVASNFLVDVGFTILEATDGFEALEICERCSRAIDIVILDLIMPKMGGVECLQKLIRLYPDIRVVIATGFSEEGSEMNLIEMGAKSYLSKPFSKLELLEAVQSVLDSTR